MVQGYFKGARASLYEPGNRTNFVTRMKFQPIVDWGEIQETKPKW